jgi:hypothetical protein
LTVSKSDKQSAIVKELAGIYRAEGILRPESVVSAASDPASPLHPCFTWDDAKAGHEYRLEEARRLIRCTVTMLPAAEQSYRAFVSLGSDRAKPGGGYRSTVHVMTSAASRAELLEQALSEMKRWQARYATLVELSPVFEALDAVTVKRLRRRSVAAT